MAPPFRLPPAPPSRVLLLTAVGLAALALLVTVAGVFSLLCIGGCNGAVVGLTCLVLGPGTVTLCTLLARGALRRPRDRRRQIMLLHGTLAGALNAVIGVLIVEVILSVIMLPEVQRWGSRNLLGGAGEVAQLLGLHLVGAGVAAAVGALLGLMFSALLWLPVRALGREPSLDARDRFHVSLGGWAAGLAASCASLMGLAGLNRHFYERFDGEAIVLLGLALVGAAGAVLALSALRRERQRSRWLDRVRRDEVPGWAVVQASAVDGAATAALLPLGAPPHEGVLVVREAAGGVYRRQVALVPVARVRTGQASTPRALTARPRAATPPA